MTSTQDHSSSALTHFWRDRVQDLQSDDVSHTKSNSWVRINMQDYGSRCLTDTYLSFDLPQPEHVSDTES